MKVSQTLDFLMTRAGQLDIETSYRLKARAGMFSFATVSRLAPRSGGEVARACNLHLKYMEIYLCSSIHLYGMAYRYGYDFIFTFL
jgi:hypothetical protein